MSVLINYIPTGEPITKVFSHVPRDRRSARKEMKSQAKRMSDCTVLPMLAQIGQLIAYLSCAGTIPTISSDVDFQSPIHYQT